MKRYSVTVTSKGQFTLPREAREAMGVSPGDRLELFVTRDGETVLRPLIKPASAIFGRGQAYAKPVVESERMSSVAAAVAGRGAKKHSRKAG
jgi:antitoxin PrlF